MVYLEKMGGKTEGPTLEVGSKDYGNTQDFRGLIGGDYVGLDLESGKNVDVVHDLSEGTGPLEPESFGFIICCSILEHVKNPFKVAETLTNLLKPGGKIYVSTPWIQRYHKYPDDYWRFTFPALKLLFSELELTLPYLSTFTAGEFMDLERYPDGDNSLAIIHDNRKYLPCYELHTIGVKRAN
jgi:SAM-dependent methyltransferase